MTFGAKAQVTGDVAGMMLRSFVGAGVTHTPEGSLIDTARVYQSPTGPEGDTEATLGQVFCMSPSLQERASIATKANAMMPPHFSLSALSVVEQCNTSLERMGVDSVDLFYLHSPDINTDIEDSLTGVDQLHKEGKIVEFGLSNYPAWAVVDIWYRCKRRDMVLPTVYQGMYNLLTRDIEREIFPVARQFGLRCYMYNPLAGGLLSGRYQKLEDLASAVEGRFSEQFDDAFSSKMKAGTVMYRARYSKKPIFDGLALLHAACAPPDDGACPAGKNITEDTTTVENGVKVRVIVEETARRPQGLSMANVSLRWLIHHSLLAKGDGIILGVSKPAQLAGNLQAFKEGPLDAKLLAACEEAWEAARPACEAYFRGYGARPGGVEKFLALKAAQRQEDEGTGEPAAKRQKA